MYLGQLSGVNQAEQIATLSTGDRGKTALIHTDVS